MSVKTILVCLGCTHNIDGVIKAATQLARQNDAHLIGLHVLEALIVYPAIATHIPGSVYAEFNKSQRATAAGIQKKFEDATRNEDFVSEWRLLKADGSTAVELLIESARCADLVVLSQQDQDAGHPAHADMQSRVIRESGRPVLIVPVDYDADTIGTSALVGWSGTQESARAAHDLCTILEPEAPVCLLHAGPQPSDDLGDFAMNEMAEMYARHGFQPTLTHRPADNKSIGQVLSNEAFEIGADLIAAGAYGHSRTYDFVVGAATSDLLENAKAPVLFSK